jgi:HTH-type transcriptional regulator / antitoxin HigA
MRTNRALHSDLALPPGEYLAEVIDELGMSQVDVARRMGRPVQAINEIIKGHKAITPDTALQLEQVTGVPAALWTGLEEEYRLVLARQQEQAQLAEEAELVDPALYRAMAKLGWVKHVRDKLERVRELWKFFGVASLHNLPEVTTYSPAFRLSTAAVASSYALAAWLRQGELEARKIAVHPYEAERLKSALSSLRALTLETPEVFLPRAQTLLARCGVALVVLPHLPKTYAHGATFWLTPSKAVVQMSIRGSWADIFWFSLFHELAHVLLHSKRHMFIEGKGGADPAWRTQEDEANSFAGDVLIPPGPYRAFTGQGLFTAGAIRQFAAQRGIAPGVVVGRLQHDSFIERNKVNGLREQYRWAGA